MTGTRITKRFCKFHIGIYNDPWHCYQRGIILVNTTKEDNIKVDADNRGEYYQMMKYTQRGK